VLLEPKNHLHCEISKLQQISLWQWRHKTLVSIGIAIDIVIDVDVDIVVVIVAVLSLSLLLLLLLLLLLSISLLFAFLSLSLYFCCCVASRFLPEGMGKILPRPTTLPQSGRMCAGSSPLASGWYVHHGDVAHGRGGVVVLPPLAVCPEVQCAPPPPSLCFPAYMEKAWEKYHLSPATHDIQRVFGLCGATMNLCDNVDIAVTQIFQNAHIFLGVNGQGSKLAFSCPMGHPRIL